jgi:MFS family permease
MKAQSGFYGWKLLVAMWIIMVANCGFPLMGVSVAGAYMAVNLHFSRSTLGLAFGVFQLMTGLPGPLVALSVNKKGVRFTLLLGSLLLVAGSILMTQFVRTGAQVVIVFGVVVGLGYIMGGPLAAQPCIARWFVNRRALAISLLLTGIPIGSFVAPPVVTWIIQGAHGNWHAAWWLIAALGAVSALMAVLFVKESPAAVGQFPDGATAASHIAAAAAPAVKRPVFRTTEVWTFAEVLRSPAFWLVLISALGFSTAYYLFLAHGVIHFRDLGYSPAQAAASLSVLALFQLLGTLLVAALGDHIEPRLIMAMSMLACGAGMMMALKANGPAGLYLCAVVLGLGIGNALPCMMTLAANYFGEKAYASVVGLLAVSGCTAGAGASYGAGYVYDHFGSYSIAFYSSSMLCLVGFVILLLMKAPARKAPHPMIMAARAF